MRTCRCAWAGRQPDQGAIAALGHHVEPDLLEIVDIDQYFRGSTPPSFDVVSCGRYDVVACGCFHHSSDFGRAVSLCMHLLPMPEVRTSAMLASLPAFLPAIVQSEPGQRSSSRAPSPVAVSTRYVVEVTRNGNHGLAVLRPARHML